MTKKEITETLQRQPEIMELMKAYIEAKKRNPQRVEQALPVILRILTGGPHHGKMESIQR